MKIRELINSLGKANVPCDFRDFEVKGISCNSKSVADNFIFVAIKGNRADGNSFIEEAIKKGAKAVITQSAIRHVTRSSGKAFFIKVKDTRKALAKLAAEFYGNPSKKINVVGVTGTNGKTTITYLIEALLKEAGKNPAVIGTINYRFKDKILFSQNTTPGPVELQSMLWEMLGQGVDYAIIEVSSHALDQDRTAGINFHSAIFTNLTQDHLDYHKTINSYFAAKAKLFKGLTNDSFAVINNDDAFANKLKRITNSSVISYGIENKSDVMAEKLKFDINRTEFKLLSPDKKINLRTNLIGKHNVYNILAAVSWAIREGISHSVIKSAIEKFSLVPGRLEKIDCGQDFSIFVDYAHTEDALKNIISALRYLAKKRIIVVFGCGGERDKTKRLKMGRVVAKLSDYAIITSDNPRSEDPIKIIEQIKKGMGKNNYCVIPERREAIKTSLSLAESGDIVLVAGKGHENYQILKDKVVHFDDREAIRECLK